MIHEVFNLTTDMFEVSKVEAHFINPRCFGEDFAAWLSSRLAPVGITPSSPIQEDFGWVLMLPFRGRKFTLAIGIMDESIGCLPAEWYVAVGFEKPLNRIGTWFKKPPADDLQELSGIVRAVLSAEPRILNVVSEANP